jgi:predicted nucleotidyltransferase
MGPDTISIETEFAVLRQFALALHDSLEAGRVLLFGSRARGDNQGDSDFDFIIISPRFEGMHLLRRASGIHEIWWYAGGQGAMDLICLTPQEFEEARHRISLVAAVLPEAIDLLPEPDEEQGADASLPIRSPA